LWLALAGTTAQAQCSAPPMPQPRSAAQAPQTLDAKACRKDAGRHCDSA
jgi:hypothetical protein